MQYWLLVDIMCQGIQKNGSSKICGRHPLKNLKW